MAWYDVVYYKAKLELLYQAYEKFIGRLQDAGITHFWIGRGNGDVNVWRGDITYTRARSINYVYNDLDINSKTSLYTRAWIWTPWSKSWNTDHWRNRLCLGEWDLPLYYKKSKRRIRFGFIETWKDGAMFYGMWAGAQGASGNCWIGSDGYTLMSDANTDDYAQGYGALGSKGSNGKADISYYADSATQMKLSNGAPGSLILYYNKGTLRQWINEMYAETYPTYDELGIGCWEMEELIPKLEKQLAYYKSLQRK